MRLKELLKTSASPKEAITIFAHEMMAKYPYAEATNPLQIVIECKWVVTYLPSRRAVAGTVFLMILTLFLALVGVHIHGGYQTLTFSTFHAINKGQRFWFTVVNGFKKIFLMITMLVIAVLGFIGAFILVGILVAIGIAILSPNHTQDPASPPMTALQVFISIVTITSSVLGSIALGFATYKFQIYVKSWGTPPNTEDDFTHRMISLRSTREIKPS